MNISLREITYILAIAEEGSITKAAGKLFIAQPSLSQAVKRIESDLGTPLFSRIKGGLALTEAGKYFVEAGRRIDGIAAEMESNITDLSKLQGGSLRLGTPYHLGAYVVPELLSIFRKQYPLVSVTLTEAPSDSLETLICDGSIDAALMPLPIKQNCIQYHPFFKSRMVLVMSKDSPYNKFAYCGDPNDRLLWFDLCNAADAPFLIGIQGQRIRTVTEIVFRRAGIVPNIVMRSRNVETIRRIAAVGYGLAIMPEHYLSNFDQSIPANYYYLPPRQDYDWTIVLAYYEHGYMPHPVSKLLEIVDQSPMRNIKS